ncbi:25S rRNA (cytosine(2278)-C(5))-methyltransferase [Purpureocillium takamizusanense]|uniref:25S rRNA (Cytosine(2278)-C(5))-methyltransferase n=1 Tax=Purpureocillium takamizusanense TaxID=2060973 RepID=A0A9Q8Q780_9HYPO|nr:25S rRNA (cytosine(2278)-C(5))-methyltransferase [Purpureocillium takamizusanense]UNI14320.1 25S rRNA (cytosine(2278)-C(5))-methyltransferase [Purpureocillium takamizusanense]
MSLYHEAAEILSSSSTEGGSLKSRVFKKKNIKSSPNQLYALVLETSKWSSVLKEAIESAELLKHERKLTPTLSLLLVHDLLLAKGGIALPQSHGLRASIERHRARLTSELTRARLRRKAATLDALRQQIDKASAPEEAGYPRWVRVNALKSSIEEQLETTFAKYDRAGSVGEVVSNPGRCLYIDPHVPNLVAVTSGTDLTKTEAYSAGKVILQDKASCFPAYLLDPRSEDGDVIDACAAPGNKTTHLASIIHAHRPEFESPAQTIYAFEKDPRRAQTLEKMVNIAGSKKMTRIALGQDFLQVDPNAERFKDVGALLLDPSCSGSGIVGRDSMPELHLPEPPAAAQGKGNSSRGSTSKRKRKHEQIAEQSQNTIRDDDGNEVLVKSEKDMETRLQSLSSFQLTLLLHAFRFPAARKVSYSTCSVHSQENEDVVMKALGSDIAKERGWRILPRDRQVTGMKDWPVRGLVEACGGDKAIADGCIRSYKDDGHGVMGFFVAGFVREGACALDPAGDAEQDGPYMRDAEGRIIRDMLGMPVSKATGEPISLVGRDEADRDVDAQSNGPSKEESAESATSEDDSSEETGEPIDGDDTDEWEGFGE